MVALCATTIYEGCEGATRGVRNKWLHQLTKTWLPTAACLAHLTATFFGMPESASARARAATRIAGAESCQPEERISDTATVVTDAATTGSVKGVTNQEL